MPVDLLVCHLVLPIEHALLADFRAVAQRSGQAWAAKRAERLKLDKFEAVPSGHKTLLCSFVLCPTALAGEHGLHPLMRTESQCLETLHQCGKAMLLKYRAFPGQSETIKQMAKKQGVVAALTQGNFSLHPSCAGKSD